jgi:hypothetical protein
MRTIPRYDMRARINTGCAVSSPRTLPGAVAIAAAVSACGVRAPRTLPLAMRRGWGGD